MDIHTVAPSRDLVERDILPFRSPKPRPVPDIHQIMPQNSIVRKGFVLNIRRDKYRYYSAECKKLTELVLVSASVWVFLPDNYHRKDTRNGSLELYNSLMPL